MTSGSLLWNRLRGASFLKKKIQWKLQYMFVALICLIFIFVLCSELYIAEYSEPIFYKNQSQPRNKTFFQIIKDSIYVLKKQIHSSRNEKGTDKLLANSFSEQDAFEKFLQEPKRNKTFFFNSTNTFHKLFRTWLNSRASTLPIKITFMQNPKHLCADQGKNLPLLIAVTSSASHLESRAAIRDTWGTFAKDKGAKVVFFLGIPTNSKYQSRINDENTKFQDIIQATFLDSYSNLTLKTISVLKWVTKVCPLVKYVLKVDDDMFINVENFLNVTKDKMVSKAIMGELAHEWPPVRGSKNKWYASYAVYPFNIYPDFVFGPSYLLTGDSVKILYNTSVKMKLFHLEDVYITGFVAESVNVTRINLPAMFNTPRDLQACNFKKLLSSHGHTPPDMRRHWMWLTRKNFECTHSTEKDVDQLNNRKSNSLKDSVKFQ